MELMLPLLGLAGLYIVSIIVNFYMLVQFALCVSRKQKHRSWSIAWFISNGVFVSGFVLRLVHPQIAPPSAPVVLEAICFVITPFLLLITLYLFKRSSKKHKVIDNTQSDLEREYILDIRQRDDVWPPPPR